MDLKGNKLQTFIMLLKNSALLIIIPTLFLLNSDHEYIKDILVFILSMLFLVEGFIIYSTKKLQGIVSLLVGLFLIIIILII